MRCLPEIVVTLALAAASLSGCIREEGSETPEDFPAQSLEERACPEESALTYEDFGAPFVITWCNGCHSSGMPPEERAKAPASVNFDTLDDVRFHADRMWARAADHNTTMPPVAGPDDIEREMLGEWLACGAPASGDYYR